MVTMDIENNTLNEIGFETGNTISSYSLGIPYFSIHCKCINLWKVGGLKMGVHLN